MAPYDTAADGSEAWNSAEKKKGASTGLSLTAKLINCLAIVVAGVIALFVAAVLADGKSVIKLKDPSRLPRVTNPELRSEGWDHRLDELLGQTYGIGLHHDQSGRSWTAKGSDKTLTQLLDDLGMPVVVAALPRVIMTDALKHPVPLLECNGIQAAGLLAMYLGFIAEAVAVLMLIFHSLALADMLPRASVRPLGMLIWGTLTLGFMIVINVAVEVYTTTFVCKQQVIPTIRLDDHFDYNYGFSFAVCGYVAALLVFAVVTMYCPNAGLPNGAVIGKILIIFSVGLALCGVNSVVPLLSGFDEKFVDPNVNPCEGQKPSDSGPGDYYFSNVDCMKDGVVQVLEQAGANVTKGYRGGLDAADRVPITESYDSMGLCPVNVHWHLGAEHLSVGQFDEMGTGPPSSANASYSGRRQLAGEVRRGFRCHHYDASDPKYTTPYEWKYCTNMQIGETYEIHWPHSAAGACGTKFQYQTPFYDGVFCKDGIITVAPLNTYEKIGVQSQTFTIVNDEDYYYGDLIKGMIVSDTQGADMAMYTGSTTGTTRDNDVCSRYTSITWKVDRTCHQISASSFDKLCKDMLDMADDMSGDVYPHGSRTLVADHLTANNQQSRQ